MSLSSFLEDNVLISPIAPNESFDADANDIYTNEIMFFIAFYVELICL